MIKLAVFFPMIVVGIVCLNVEKQYNDSSIIETNNQSERNETFLEAELIITKELNSLPVFNESNILTESLEENNNLTNLALNETFPSEMVQLMAMKNQFEQITNTTTTNVSRVAKQDPLNLMSYFNARNLTQSQLEMLKTLLTGACWRDSFGRGSGEGVSVCDDGEDQYGALCYPKCEIGYEGIGPVDF